MKRTAVQESVASRVKEARESRGWSQGELARQTDISTATISRAERGETVPSQMTLRAIAQATGVSVEWLDSGDGPMRESRSQEYGNNGGGMKDAPDRGAPIPHQDRLETMDVYEPDQTNGEDHDTVYVDRRDLVQRYGDRQPHLRRRYMHGDTMRGSIGPNAPIESEPVQGEFVGEGVYFLHIDGNPVVARVQVVGGGYLLKRDSPQWDDEVYLRNEEGEYVSERTGQIADLQFIEKVRAAVTEF